MQSTFFQNREKSDEDFTSILPRKHDFRRLLVRIHSGEPTTTLKQQQLRCYATNFTILIARWLQETYCRYLTFDPLRYQHYLPSGRQCYWTVGTLVT